ncbi:hypothetical protein [Bacteroides acidifaciens]|jgi:hypothetical protein|uniref:hypothetical protein n=1 Tax=Bacteroides acidifaciens TaxID=85831 RepID=UPI0025B38AD9|nr:hypothetical protein [Bacteroides acidifaciens]
MKVQRYLPQLFVTFVCATFASCQSADDKTESKYELDPKDFIVMEVEIAEILKPIDMTLNENYLCLLHEEESEGEQIFVFNADNLNFLYKFAKRGPGPQETLALDFMKDLRGDSIDLIDQANYKKLTYVLTPDSARLVETKYLDLPHLGPLQESHWVNDSIMIFNTAHGDILTYNDNTNYIVDRINISELVEGIPEESANKYGAFNFSLDNKDIIVGLRFFNDIFKFKLDDQFKFIRENRLSVSSDNINMDELYDNYGYYSYINAGGNYVLAQYYGYKMKALQPFPINLNGSNLKYDLILLDNNLKPLAIYPLNTDILRAFLDPYKRRIYYWDAFKDFEQLKYIEF